MWPGEVIGALLLPMAFAWLMPLISQLLGRMPGGRRLEPRESAAPSPLPRLLFLVPAHDESLLIATTLHSLLSQRSAMSRSRVIVIADNCRDDTAGLSRGLGAEVLERVDPAKPGKPAAVAWALDRLVPASFEALVVIDADTVVDPGFADALAAYASLQDLALQGRFGVANPGASWLTRLATLWVDVRYDQEFARKQKSGLNVVLTGNGMCFGRRWLERVGWVPEGLTEDLALYARATAMGMPIAYAPQARLFAQEAQGMEQSVTQRQRWQAGRLQVLRETSGALLRSRSIGAAQKLDALAELFLPGPVIHTSLALLAAGGLALSGVGGVGHVTAGLFLLSIVPLAAGTIAALLRRRDRWRLLLDLLMLPAYAAWRIALSLSTWLRGQDGEWRRSPRHAPPRAP